LTSSRDPAPGELLLLLSDPRARAALIDALSPPHGIRTLHDPLELFGISRENSPIACIFDMFESGQAFPPPWLRAAREHHPYLAFLTASDSSGRDMDMYGLGKTGVDGVIRWDANPSQRDIVVTLDLAVCAALARGVLAEFQDVLPFRAHRALGWSIEHALESPQVSDLASALTLSPSRLARELKKAGTVPPRRLLVWGRLIVASHLLGHPDETVESVAFRLGYSTGGSLGKAVKENLGCSPTELLRRGGLAWVSKVLREAITPPKDAAKRPPREGMSV